MYCLLYKNENSETFIYYSIGFNRAYFTTQEKAAKFANQVFGLKTIWVVAKVDMTIDPEI